MSERSAATGAGDGRRQPAVARRHVVERAVRLDVLQPHAFGGGDAGHRRDLVEDEIFGLRRA